MDGGSSMKVAMWQRKTRSDIASWLRATQAVCVRSENCMLLVLPAKIWLLAQVLSLLFVCECLLTSSS